MALDFPDAFPGLEYRRWKKGGTDALTDPERGDGFGVRRFVWALRAQHKTSYAEDTG